MIAILFKFLKKNCVDKTELGAWCLVVRYCRGKNPGIFMSLDVRGVASVHVVVLLCLL